MASPNQRKKQRIASLAPSATSILVALGARRQLVGVSKWCADVANVGRLPRLGDCWSLDARQVMRLKPTLVIGSVPYKQEAVARLLEQPVAFLAMNPRTLADVESDILLLGRLVGREHAARKLIGRIRKVFRAIAAQAKNRNTENTESTEGTEKSRKRLRVYCEAWPKPRISSPPWVAELVAIAGGQMVVPAGQRVSDDDVASAKPDVIVLAWTATGGRAKTSSALENPAWQNLPAVRNRRVYVVRDELLNTPGPPLVAGARELARIVRSVRREAAESRRHGA
jgi:iron complex transport system substrate-binding protein